jgi:hypothetical protein
MAKAPSILNADRGRASATASGIFCLLAAVQVILVIHAFWKSSDRASVGGIPAVSQQADPLIAPLPPVLPTVSFTPPPVGQLAPPVPSAAPPSLPERGFAPPAIGSFAPLTSAGSTPVTAPPPPVSPPVLAPLPETVSPVSAPASIPGTISAKKPEAGPGGDMTLEEMIELAKQVRGLGDMQGALEVLKRADLHFPGRPEVLAETAQCYETMGLADKAAGIWRQLEGMNETEAAGFRDLAQRRLNTPASMSPSQPSGISGMITGDGVKTLSLGACQAIRDPSVANGEKVVLRIPILRQGNTTLDPSQVDIDVYFFDRVNGEKIAQTIADEPVSTWADAPVDWSGIGEEPLDVTYFLPALTPGEIAAHGRRSYHGYVVRLYYQHKLQDVAAEPRDLLDFGSRTPQAVPGGVNPLLPPLMN